MKELNITIDEVKFHCYEVGDSRLPALVCLHGMTGDSRSFFCLKEDLQNNFHVILIDGPGHGESEELKREEDYMFSVLAQQIFKVVQKITTETFYLLGHSWGADICLHLANLFPEKIRGLILIDGGYVFPEQVEELTGEMALKGWQDYIEKSRYKSWDEVIKEYESYTTKQWDTNLNSLIISNFKKDNDSYILKAKLFSILAIIKAFYQEPCSTTYAGIRCPVLFFHATLPVIDSSREKGVLKIKNSIKNLKVIGIENTKHNIHWDCPEIVAHEILAWKQECSWKTNTPY